MTRPNVLFGYSIGLSGNGDTLAVAEYDADRGKGALYVLTRSGGTWSHQARIQADNAENGDSLGYSMAISDDGNTIAAGAADEDCLIPGVNPAGCDNDQPLGYVGRRGVRLRAKRQRPGPSRRSSSPRIRHKRTGSASASRSAATAIRWPSARPTKTARREASTATRTTTRRAEAGAVYFFTRTGTTWIQQAYVKSSNTDAGDEFGSSIALSQDGKTMLVGARGEDSGAKGVNGNQADNSARDAGAAYLFVR